ncbi:MAG: hypothetical protein WA843_01545 [Candidatus Saccharimonadales bacterium]
MLIFKNPRNWPPEAKEIEFAPVYGPLPAPATAGRVIGGLLVAAYRPSVSPTVMPAIVGSIIDTLMEHPTNPYSGDDSIHFADYAIAQANLAQREGVAA